MNHALQTLKDGRADSLQWALDLALDALGYIIHDTVCTQLQRRGARRMHQALTWCQGEALTYERDLWGLYHLWTHAECPYRQLLAWCQASGDFRALAELIKRL